MELAPTAYLKMWWNEGRPCCRVDMSEICEPWLDALKPTITPLYPAAAIRREAQFLCERLRDFAHEVDASDTEDIYREFHGHVAPSIARLETALAQMKEPAR